MKATILNGMEPDDTSVASVQRILMDAVQDRHYDVEPFVLHALDIRPCGGCFGCWLQTPGRCLMPDTDEIAEAVAASDLIIYLTPVRFGGYSSHLKKVVDHLIFLILPFFRTVNGETHHVPRYTKGPRLLAIGVMDQHDGESEAIFTDLVEANAINMAASRWAGGVIATDQGIDGSRRAIENLLADVEVGR